jgi:hypothetical protein
VRHRILTCENHPDLRWSTKEIAWSEGVGYNGCRTLFFDGRSTGHLLPGKSAVECEPAEECDCGLNSDDFLILAPEDADVMVNE